MIANNSVSIIILIILAGALPFLAVTITAFAKISIVLFIVRSALGVQQAPPNIVMYSISLILSLYVAMPVLGDMYHQLEIRDFDFQNVDDWMEAATAATVPLKAFLSSHTDPTQSAFFRDSATTIWGDKYGSHADPNSLMIMVPSFLLTELTKAFEIGFLLYLPFMAIDIIVTTVLVALGMMMVSPTVISIPFKLMLFIFLDAWTKIAHGLILSYA
jgi:type III secretion protein R